MTFEVNENDKGNGQLADQSIQAAGTNGAVTSHDIRLALRCRQAALDVVLDGCSLIRAQSRLMSVVDRKDWDQAFVLVKFEVDKYRENLTVGASFEDLVLAAEDTGEDIQSLAQRLGVQVEMIADVLDNRNTVKI